MFTLVSCAGRSRPPAGRRRLFGRRGNDVRGSGRHCDVREGWGQRGAAQGLAIRLVERSDDFRSTGARGRRTRHHHVGAAGQFGAMSPEVVAQHAFDAIADHSARIDFPRHCQSQPSVSLIGQIVQCQQRGGRTAALGEDRVELRTRAYPRSARVSGGGCCDGRPGIHERRTFMPVASGRAHQATDRTGGGRRCAPGAVPWRSGGEALATLGTTTGQDLATVGGLHAGTETVVALALEVAGLVGALGGHDRARLRGALRCAGRRECCCSRRSAVPEPQEPAIMQVDPRVGQIRRRPFFRWDNPPGAGGLAQW